MKAFQILLRRNGTSLFQIRILGSDKGKLRSELRLQERVKEKTLEVEAGVGVSDRA